MQTVYLDNCGLTSLGQPSSGFGKNLLTLHLENNIGLVVKHSDLMNVFFQEIENKENIFFISPQKLSQKKNYHHLKNRSYLGLLY